MTVAMAGAPEHRWSVVVTHDAAGARLARQRLATELAHLLPTELLVDAAAVLAELVANAVRHARPLPGGVVRVAAAIQVGLHGAVLVRVRVTDGGAPHQPAERSASPDAVNGRGLRIVSALAAKWGVEPDGSGTCVWAELGTPAPRN